MENKDTLIFVVTYYYDGLNQNVGYFLSREAAEDWIKINDVTNDMYILAMYPEESE